MVQSNDKERGAVNVYEVYSTDVWSSPRYDPPEPPECEDYWGIVAAESRGKAKALALADVTRNGRRFWRGEYTDLKTHVLARNKDIQPGVQSAGSEYETIVCQRGHDVSSCFECDTNEGCGL